VYRARDPRLERDVAIRVLPEAFTADAGRVVRFEQEAKAIAALSHPNDRTRGMSRLPWNRCRARATHRAHNAQPRLWDRA
jgi:serine/threonine protein kinase